MASKRKSINQVKGPRRKQAASTSQEGDLASEVKESLARQIAILRGEMSQAAFGKLIGKPQSVVSRLEDPEYGKVTLQTLLDVAAKLDVALAVQFVSHKAYRRLMEPASSDSLQSSRQPSKEKER